MSSPVIPKEQLSAYQRWELHSFDAPTAAAQPEPADAAAWDQAIVAVRRDRKALQALIADRAVDLFAKIPHGHGQTILREILLVADHTAYHVGQLVIVRRLLGNWPVA